MSDPIPVTRKELEEFVQWVEGIFADYRDLKPDHYDDEEVQQETAEALEADEAILEAFKVKLNPS